MNTFRTIARTGIVALLALTLASSCKKVDDGPKTLTDLTGWIIYTTTDGEMLNQYCAAELNNYIDDYGYDYYDEKKGIRYVHVSNIPEDFHDGFYHYKNLKTIDLAHVDFSHCTSFKHLFCGCTSLEKVDMSGLDIHNVKTMVGMFLECENLKEVKMDGTDASNVENISVMFEKCTSLETVDLSGAKNSKCTNTVAMFVDCSSLKSFNLGQFGECPKKETYDMFKGCTSLKTIDLSEINWELHDFYNCDQISQTLAGTSPSEIKIPAILTEYWMATVLQGVESDGTLYYPKGTDPEYALLHLQKVDHKWNAVEY